jgi:hypothetical protein
VPLTESVNP